MKQPYNTALYMRLSRDDENYGDSVSIETQRTILQQYAKEHGLSVYGEYVDDGWSGTNFERPSFQRMMDDVEAGKVNCIITKDLSRFGREHVMMDYYLEFVFPEKQIRYIAVAENEDTEKGLSDFVPFKNLFNEWFAKDMVTSNIGGIESEVSVPVDEWVHLAMVKDAENVTLYMNGEVVAQKENPFDMANQDTNFRIGGNMDGSGGLVGAFKGAIDEVLIYTAALSEDEVKAIAGGELKPETYTVNVEGGSGSGQYMKGASVIITAEAPENSRFMGWTSDSNVKFEDDCAVTTSFIMTDSQVNVAAEFETDETEEEIPSVASYLIKATAGEGGTINPAGSVWVTMGVNKTFTIKADEGYVIADVLVDGVSVGAVSEYTFEKVSTKHTIEAVFKSTEGGETEDGFTDVPSDAWYAEAVKYVTEQGLMNGTSESTFAPLMNLSRSMMAQIFYNMEQRPETSGSNPFTDVADGQWYTDAVIWAAEQEIVNGYGGAFQPDGDITREQLAVMLYRYAAYKKLDVTASADGLDAFADGGTVSDWAVDAMAWAVKEGILTGKSGGLLDPQGTATRAEVATILMRFCSEDAER